ncbi:DUF305 domain-containing protein [Actinoplanes sp. NPDC089786]|uniref:DUF305 domain-containing protein n=1 Tax=Actinoplanes sp. NPDC089786 TaxID=3155185 RepID=UPI0034296C43
MRFHRYAALAVLIASGLLATILHQSDPPAATPAPVGQVVAPPTVADLTFARMMVSHHEQAVRMSRALIAKPGVPERVGAIAEFIAHDQQREIDELTNWLVAWDAGGAPAGGHEHGGAGMLTETQLRDLDRAPGNRAAPIFLRLMIEHHTGAITMARDLLTGGGRNVFTHRMAKHVVNEQSDENTAMTALLRDDAVWRRG